MVFIQPIGTLVVGITLRGISSILIEFNPGPIFGIRIGTEEPHYLATPVSGRIEMRRYGPRIAAETTVAADEDRARSIGFRRLASYIFGANHRDEKSERTLLSGRRMSTLGASLAPRCLYRNPS